MKLPIVRNTQSDDIYQYFGNDEYLNIRTGVKGKIEPEIAQKCLKINLECTELIGEYPLIKEMINKLNLKIEK